MNIKQRLRLLESLPRNSKESGHQNLSASGGLNISAVIQGKQVNNQYGSYFYTEKFYPLETLHGQVQLGACLEFPAKLLTLLDNKLNLPTSTLNKTLFIDTETTGLSGGVGTCAFLIGVGYFVDLKFRVAQYFMNDFDEEAALLHDFNKLVENFDTLLTYNGKSFDIPLISSRHIYHRVKSRLGIIPHFDLLHSVRRLWKHRLPDCSLTTAEAHLLQVHRHGDIPGSMIPTIYFQYLRTKNAGQLQPVFYHNQQDIISMTALLALALGTVKSPLSNCHSSADVQQIGKVFEHAEDYQQAIGLYRHQVQHEEDSFIRRELILRIGFAYKKLEQWAEAANAWQEAMGCGFHPLAYIEFAKHLEHRDKNYSQAINLVEKALSELEILAGLLMDEKWASYREDLLYRLDRLKKKSQ